MLSSKIKQPLGTVAQGLAIMHNRSRMSTVGRKLQLVRRSMSSAPATYTFETLNVTRPKDFVVQVEVNRPDKRNAQNMAFYREMAECFKQLADDIDCRVVVLSAAGKIFSAGIDFADLQGDLLAPDVEPGRRAVAIKKTLIFLQEGFGCIEKCPKPVIAAVHNACVGGGVDLISACDIRYATQDAWFQIKEVDIGLAADLGTLQRMPKVVGNESWVREVAFTARKFDVEEARTFGFISRVFPDKEKMVDAAIKLAEDIAEKSPIAVQGTKVNLVYTRDHSVPEALEYIMTWNTAMLQSEDVVKAAMAAITKEKATFSKL